MIVNFDKKLNKLAQLVVAVGINVSEGDEVVISSLVSSADFARALARNAYECGAKNGDGEYGGSKDFERSHIAGIIS